MAGLSRIASRTCSTSCGSASKTVRMKKRSVSSSEYCWFSTMLAETASSAADTAATMPGRSSQVRVMMCRAIGAVWTSRARRA